MANQLTFVIDYNTNDPEKPVFDVIYFEGRETVSRPYEFTVNLRSETEVVKTNLLSRRATFTIAMDDTTTNPVQTASSVYHGIIVAFLKKDKIGGYYHYRAIVVPKFSSLGMFRKSDVFIETPLYKQGTENIMETLLKEGMLSSQDQLIVLKSEDKYNSAKDPYNRFAYVCQYEETDLDFLSRLIEREGIYYYFDQAPLKRNDKGEPEKDTNGNYIVLSQEQVVFTDRKDTNLSRANNLRYRFLTDQSTAPDPNAMHNLSLEQSMLPRKVTIVNYGYEKVSLGDAGVISCSAFVSNDGKEDTTLQGEIRIYGENFINPNTGGDGYFLATIRAQEIFCRGSLYSGRSTAVPFMPGMLITLDEGASSGFKGNYFVVEVIHRGQQQLSGMQPINDYPSFYENAFVIIPSGIQFRPQRQTPRPRIYSTMNAIVDGEALSDGKESEYAQIDDKGRYKVKLPFPATSKGAGKGSVWIRMASPYAGAGGKTYGIHFPLHKGAEVIISFRDGDPDQPVISGSLFNSSNANVVKSNSTDSSKDNSSQSIIQSAGGHKIIMEDKEGKKSFGMYCSLKGEEGSWLWVGNEDSPSFELKSKGSKHEVVCGQEDSIVLGAENWITVGSKMEAVLGQSSDFTVGVKFGVEAGAVTEVKFGPHLEFGKTTERIKDEDDLLGTDKVTISAGLSAAEKLIVEGSRTGLTLGVAAFFALAGALAGESGSYVFPHEEEGTGALKSMAVSLGAATASTIAEGIALGVLAKKLNPKNFHPLSKIELDGQGVKIQADSTASHGIKTGVDRAGTMSSFIEIKPVILTNNDTITISNNKTALIEMDKGDSITIKRDTGNASGAKVFVNNDRVEIAKGGGGGNVLVDGNSATMTYGQGNQIKFTNGLCKMEQGGKSISIDQGSIKMKLDANEVVLSSAAIEAKGNFIKLG